jgi:hypothetical protein
MNSIQGGCEACCLDENHGPAESTPSDNGQLELLVETTKERFANRPLGVGKVQVPGLGHAPQVRPLSRLKVFLAEEGIFPA